MLSTAKSANVGFSQVCAIIFPPPNPAHAPLAENSFYKFGKKLGVNNVHTGANNCSTCENPTLADLPVLSRYQRQLDGCIVWNAHNTVLGGEAPLIYIVPVCYVKQVGMENLVISLLVYTGKKFQL